MCRVEQIQVVPPVVAVESVSRDPVRVLSPAGAAVAGGDARRWDNAHLAPVRPARCSAALSEATPLLAMRRSEAAAVPCRDGAAKESNLPSAGLRRPAGFEARLFLMRLGRFAGLSVTYTRVGRGHICRFGDTVRDTDRARVFGHRGAAGTGCTVRRRERLLDR